MNMPSAGTVKYYKEKYPVGAKVELVKMDDRHAPPSGTKGTVMFVDDMATVHVAWENGSSLGAVYGEDIIKLI